MTAPLINSAVFSHTTITNGEPVSVTVDISNIPTKVVVVIGTQSFVLANTSGSTYLVDIPAGGLILQTAST